MEQLTKYTILPLEVKNQDGRQIEISGGHPLLKGFSAYTSLNTSSGFVLNHFAGTHFSIWYSQYKMTEPTTLKARSDLPTLELHIALEKTFASNWDGHFRELPAEKQYDVSYTPYIKSESEFQKDISYTTFDVHYGYAFLRRFSHIKQIAAFLDKVDKKQPAMLLDQPAFLTPSMIRTVNDALTMQIDPSLSALYYESISLMLLSQLLNQFIHIRAKHLTAFEKECALHVRALISQDLTRIYSIAELCRLTGINEIKLQECFRELFGTTIFQYLLMLKMEYARQLLLDTDMPVGNIALLSGYADNPNFTTAFKKYFHCAPDRFRKNC